MATSNDTEKNAVIEVKISEIDIENNIPLATSLSAKQRFQLFISVLRRSLVRKNDAEQSPWPKIVRRGVYLLSVALVFIVIAYVIQHALLLNLIRRLSPLPQEQNGLTQIVANWTGPGSVASWLPDFSRDVVPKAIHSHNDYWRRVPLFEAMSLGITGVEADCHLINGTIYVGHTTSSLQASRTFNSLYLNPLTSILENQNAANGIGNSTSINGVWDIDPTRSLVVMTDLKTEGFSTFEAVQAALQPFREKGWLTYWNGTNIIAGPIIHVGTGNTPFEAVLNSTYSNSTYRDVFFDAPLHNLSSYYNASNSYYASTSLTALFGGGVKIPRSGLKKSQMLVVAGQVDKAAGLGLVSRYWDIPAWPVDLRMRIWRQLEGVGIGMLNADEIADAARWDWSWCSIFGVELC